MPTVDSGSEPGLRVYLGIGLGTSEVEVLLRDAVHQVIAVTGESLRISRPRPLWIERHPPVWRAPPHAATTRLACQHGVAPGGVRAAGVSAAMLGAYTLDD